MKKSRNDSHEFRPILAEIEDSPINPLGPIIFWLIIFFIIFAGAWMYLGKVDIVVTARGLVIPDGEEKIIQPLDTGVIKNILVKEGDFVKKGQLLVEIDSTTTQPTINTLYKNLEKIKLEKQRLLSEVNNQAYKPSPSEENQEIVLTQTRLFNERLNSLKKQLAIKQGNLSKLKEAKKSTFAELESKEIILKNKQDEEKRLKPVIDLIPYSQYEDVVNQITELSSQIATLNNTLKQNDYERSQLYNEINQIKSEYKAESLKLLSEKQVQESEVQTQITQAEFMHKKQKIVSPVDGYVNKIIMHTIGGVVTPAQSILSIVPKDTKLMIKASVLNQDIGFIKPDMDVSLKVDTYNFQKYGILNGKVIIVGKNSIPDENLGQIYEVYIEPLQTKLMVEGKEENIQVGMNITSEIKIGKRRVIEFFIYPLIKYLDESIKVR